MKTLQEQLTVKRERNIQYLNEAMDASHLRSIVKSLNDMESIMKNAGLYTNTIKNGFAAAKIDAQKMLGAGKAGKLGHWLKSLGGMGPTVKVPVFISAMKNGLKNMPSVIDLIDTSELAQGKENVSLQELLNSGGNDENTFKGLVNKAFQSDKQWAGFVDRDLPYVKTSAIFDEMKQSTYADIKKLGMSAKAVTAQAEAAAAASNEAGAAAAAATKGDSATEAPEGTEASQPARSAGKNREMDATFKKVRDGKASPEEVAAFKAWIDKQAGSTEAAAPATEPVDVTDQATAVPPPIPSGATPTSGEPATSPGPSTDGTNPSADAAPAEAGTPPPAPASPAGSDTARSDGSDPTADGEDAFKEPG